MFHRPGFNIAELVLFPLSLSRGFFGMTSRSYGEFLTFFKVLLRLETFDGVNSPVAETLFEQRKAGIFEQLGM